MTATHTHSPDYSNIIYREASVVPRLYHSLSALLQYQERSALDERSTSCLDSLHWNVGATTLRLSKGGFVFKTLHLVGSEDT